MQPNESLPEVRRELVAEILSTNGRPSIVQMQIFVQRVHARHAEAPAPEALLHEYQSRLDQIIAERSDLILAQKSCADDFVVFAARTILELLHQRGVKLFILSGTLENRVKQEAELLDLSRYFGGRIFGSAPDTSKFSKRAVLDKILADENLRGENMLCFGDGPVEILHARELGALSVAVASDEDHNGSGLMDPAKRAQLIHAGAHVVIPDYRDAAALLDAFTHE
jgi:phosphoglycolate phosphatase